MAMLQKISTGHVDHEKTMTQLGLEQAGAGAQRKPIAADRAAPAS
jgi:hypothetical protein